MISLSQISLLKSAISTAFQAYLCAELGDSSIAHKALKEARYAHSQACVEFIENLLDSECNKGENVCIENAVEEIRNETSII